MRLNWNQLLEPKRARPGSAHGQEQPTDYRTPFEKDYHRILQSASFRRLQDKTQVFPLDQSDFIRTRLTHSLEVSSLAKSLGQQVCRRLSQRGGQDIPNPEQQAGIADLLLCAGLIHDIGNPPFGHYGETTIRLWFQKNLDRLWFDQQPLTRILTRQMQEDLLQFEGNAQALRVLSKLHFLVDFYGMNLTYPLLHLIVKYPVPSTEVDGKHERLERHKMGYFHAEEELFRDLTTTLGTAGLSLNPHPADERDQLALIPNFGLPEACRHPLTFLLEAADDIAYRTADLEDAFKKNKMTYEQLVRGLKQALKRCGDQGTLLKHLLEYLQQKWRYALKQEYPQPEAYAIQNWVVHVQSCLLERAAEQFVQCYDSIMNGEQTTDLFTGTQAEPVLKVLGELAYRHVFHSKQIIKMELAAEAVLGGLLDRFVPACLLFDSGKEMDPVQQRLMDTISDNYVLCYKHQSRQARSEAEKLYLRLLLVTDFLSGMTDSYAVGLYRNLTGSHSL